jgi:hypothetical protein
MLDTRSPDRAAEIDFASRVRAAARRRTLRLGRGRSPEFERPWVLELEFELPTDDPEQLLAECEDFLVDGSNGERIGVVDRVEREGEAGRVSGLLAAGGWFGRRHLRVERKAIEQIIPAERRIIVREATPVPSRDGSAS